MLKVIQLATLAMFCLPLANASNTCMVTMVSGATDADGISVTFRNAGKLPIRKLEFNCEAIEPQTHKARSALCHVENGLFFPGTEYTVSYAHPTGLSWPINVSLRSATLSDAYVWKPSLGQHCRVLKIEPRKKTAP
jgi:hypothetical protein